MAVSCPSRLLFYQPSPPPQVFLKLNINESTISNPGIAGVGGIRSHSAATTIFSFSGPNGPFSINNSDKWSS